MAETYRFVINNEVRSEEFESKDKAVETALKWAIKRSIQIDDMLHIYTYRDFEFKINAKELIKEQEKYVCERCGVKEYFKDATERELAFLELTLTKEFNKWLNFYSSVNNRRKLVVKCETYNLQKLLESKI